jgi:hypothetical protein
MNKYTLTFEEEHLKVVVRYLGKGPYEEVVKVLVEIQRQLDQHKSKMIAKQNGGGGYELKRPATAVRARRSEANPAS